MQHSYYIDVGGLREGPHDLITLMRRIKNGKINDNTLIYHNEADAGIPAHTIPELSAFFEHPSSSDTSNATDLPTLTSLIQTGWRFATEHTIMTVYSGELLLITLILAALCTDSFGTVLGSIIAGSVFLIFHHFYLLFALRLYRRQPIGSAFVQQQIMPVLGSLIIACVVLAFMTVGGALLLIVPGILITIFYIFVPFLILDHKYNVVEALQGARLLLTKRGRAYIGLVGTLVLLHLVCIVLIIPIPLTLPIFAAALSELYEKISAA